VNSERKIDFQTLRAGTSERSIVGKDNVAAVLADQSIIGHNRHGMELPADNTIGTTMFFLCHSHQRLSGAVTA
jgi:hypothetical protein